MLDAQIGEGGYLVAFLVAQRLAELVLATRNTRRLRAAGGVEFGAAHYPLLVALHVFWLMGLWVYGYDRSVAPIGLVAFVMLQLGRVWVIASLGPRWTTRIIAVPGSAAIARGPYRWLRHPNYLIVILEIAVVPLALGLPFLALAYSVLNAALLTYRIRIENRALAWAAGADGVNAANQAIQCATLANDTPRR